MKLRRNDGFTLAELLITIVVGSIVALAATTVLLLGLRLNSSSSQTAESQNTTRIFLAVMEEMASNGEIRKVVSRGNGWMIEGDTDAEGNSKVLFRYEKGAKSIFTGTEETVLMEDVISSSIDLDENILTVGVETEDGAYTSSVYCRSITISDPVNEKVEGAIDNLGEEETVLEDKKARMAFLKTLLSQRGSTGMVLKELADGRRIKTPVYFSQWYNPKWPIDTPWCSCYVSWALNEVQDYVEDSSYGGGNESEQKYTWFASTDAFVIFLQDDTDTNQHSWIEFDEVAKTKPTPGDLIFFDWSGEQKDPEHVGVVLAVDSDFIYTIEGNNGNMCVVQQYARNDTNIMGFGVIDWKEDSKLDNQLNKQLNDQ